MISRSCSTSLRMCSSTTPLFSPIGTLCVANSSGSSPALCRFASNSVVSQKGSLTGAGSVSPRASTGNWYREASRRGTVTCMSSFFQIYE